MQQPRILVVDDDDVIRLNLEVFLQDEGYYVQTAASGEQGLDILAMEAIALCVVDIRLPGIDGNQFIINSQHQYPSLHYIIHTGSSDYVIPQSLLDLGVNERHLLRKPLSNMSVLSKLIETIVNL